MKTDRKLVVIQDRCFGPRGLASIVLGLIDLKQEANLTGEPLIALAVAATVLLSVFAHGISAAPAITVYANQVERMDADAPERQDAVRMPVMVIYKEPYPGIILVFDRPIMSWYTGSIQSLLHTTKPLIPTAAHLKLCQGQLSSALRQKWRPGCRLWRKALGALEKRTALGQCILEPGQDLRPRALVP